MDKRSMIWDHGSKIKDHIRKRTIKSVGTILNRFIPSF